MVLNLTGHVLLVLLAALLARQSVRPVLNILTAAAAGKGTKQSSSEAVSEQRISPTLHHPSNIRHTVMEGQPQCLGLGESEIFINTLEEFIAGFFRFTIIIGRDHSFFPSDQTDIC